MEQEAAGGDTSVLESVLECDEERSQLLKEEKELMSKLEEVCNSLLSTFQIHYYRTQLASCGCFNGIPCTLCTN